MRCLEVIGHMPHTYLSPSYVFVLVSVCRALGREASSSRLVAQSSRLDVRICVRSICSRHEATQRHRSFESIFSSHSAFPSRSVRRPYASSPASGGSRTPLQVAPADVQQQQQRPARDLHSEAGASSLPSGGKSTRELQLYPSEPLVFEVRVCASFLLCLVPLAAFEHAHLTPLVKSAVVRSLSSAFSSPLLSSPLRLLSAHFVSLECVAAAVDGSDRIVSYRT